MCPAIWLFKLTLSLFTSNSRNLLFCVSAVKQVVVSSGEDWELPCASPPGGAKVKDLQWTQEELHGYILQYKDGKLQDKHQNPTFKNRVELRDPELRSGDIRLKNVSTEDSGVYKCQAQFQTRDGGQEEVFQSVHLTVKPEVCAALCLCPRGRYSPGPAVDSRGLRRSRSPVQRWQTAKRTSESNV
uniref:Ig-like domain-containing protein n=1 Tax=Neogobius melanostomus TaxID=47308 RepID=A0A8C6T3Q3_9GOBI